MASVNGIGGYAIYDAQKPSVPSGMRELLGADFFFKVRVVHTLYADTQQVELLENLTDMKYLHLGGKRYEDSDLKYTARLRNLEALVIFNLRITDAGLKHLERLTSLAELDLSHTNVTSKGVKKLQEALPNCKIEY